MTESQKPGPGGTPLCPHLPSHRHHGHRSPPLPRPRSSGGSTLTVAEFCADLGISRSTFYEWRVKGRAPRCAKLPNGELRIRRAEYERWLTSCEENA